MKNNILSKLKTDYIKEKIHKPLCELKPQIICLNEKQIDKISKFIKKNNSNFKILKSIYPKNDIYFFINKYGEKKGLLMFKLFVVKKIKLLIKNKKFKEIYVFGLNIYSKGIIRVINNTNSLIKVATFSLDLTVHSHFRILKISSGTWIFISSFTFT